MRNQRGSLGGYAPTKGVEKICTTVLAVQKGQLYTWKLYVLYNCECECD